METLIISREELEKVGTKCEQLYLTVYAQVCAAFAIQLHRQSEIMDSTYISVVPGVSEKGYFEGNETVGYMLSLDKE